MCQENCYLVDPSDLFYSTWMKASEQEEYTPGWVKYWKK
jgi:hypothetical protein